MVYDSSIQALQELTCEKDLWILVDNTLSFDKHICEAIKKANKKLAMLWRTFVYLDKKMPVQLYTMVAGRSAIVWLFLNSISFERQQKLYPVMTCIDYLSDNMNKHLDQLVCLIYKQ